MPESSMSVLLMFSVTRLSFVSVLYLAEGSMGFALKSHVTFGCGKPSTSNVILAFCVRETLSSLGTCFRTSGANESYIVFCVVMIR